MEGKNPLNWHYKNKPSGFDDPISGTVPELNQDTVCEQEEFRYH